MQMPEAKTKHADWDDELPLTHQGFDLHVYYKPDQKEECVALKAKFCEKFPGVVMHPDNKPDTVYDSARGPHSLPMWIAEARSPADFSTMVPWMVMNHGNISVLVHPNTDNPKRDHSVGPMWLGEPAELFPEIFDLFAKLSKPQLGDLHKKFIAAGGDVAQVKVLIKEALALIE